VRGRVQGVGFRLFVQRAAVARGVTGYVRNLQHGDEVEVVARGDDDTLRALSAELRSGPPGARVTEVKVDYLDPAPAFVHFTIRY
jgi:acylphosphatase